MLDPARNHPKSYSSMAFLIAHNALIIWRIGKMGQSPKKEKSSGGFWQQSGKLGASRWLFLLVVASKTTCLLLTFLRAVFFRHTAK